MSLLLIYLDLACGTNFEPPRRISLVVRVHDLHRYDLTVNMPDDTGAVRTPNAVPNEGLFFPWLGTCERHRRGLKSSLLRHLVDLVGVAPDSDRFAEFPQQLCFAIGTSTGKTDEPK